MLIGRAAPVPTFHVIMSTEEGEAGPACPEVRGGEPQGAAAITQHRTCEEGGSQGHPHPDDEDEAGQGEEEEGCPEDRGASGGHVGTYSGGDFPGEDGAVGGRSCKVRGMNSNCSSETCIPTPSCRICFQGAEQVREPE